MTDDLRKLAEIQGRVGTHDATCPLAVIPHDWTDHSSLPLCDCGNRDRVRLLDRIAALEQALLFERQKLGGLLQDVLSIVAMYQTSGGMHPRVRQALEESCARADLATVEKA